MNRCAFIGDYGYKVCTAGFKFLIFLPRFRNCYVVDPEPQQKYRFNYFLWDVTQVVTHTFNVGQKSNGCDKLSHKHKAERTPAAGGESNAYKSVV